MVSVVNPNCVGRITSVQTKLTDYELFKEDFQKGIDKRLNKSPDLEINNPDLELDENNRLSYLNPVCPKCGSTNIIKKGPLHKEKINEKGDVINYQEQQYKCKDNGHRFGIYNNPLIKKGDRILRKIKDKTTEVIKQGHVSTRKLAQYLKIYNNIEVSHVSQSNWMKLNVDDTIINKQTDYSGYYMYDEEYLKIAGKRYYRLSLYDMKYNVPLAERITDNKQYNTILQFLKDITKNKQFIVLATDLFPMYRNITDELDVKHQLCLIHLNREINKKIKDYVRKNKLNEEDKKQIYNSTKEYKEMFFAKTPEEAKKIYNEYMTGIKEIPEPLKQFTDKHVKNHFQRYLEHHYDENIDRTTNKIENYYRQTDPEKIKKNYKTKTGILSFLTYKMEYWTEKFKKK